MRPAFPETYFGNTATGVKSWEEGLVSHIKSVRVGFCSMATANPKSLGKILHCVNHNNNLFSKFNTLIYKKRNLITKTLKFLLCLDFLISLILWWKRKCFKKNYYKMIKFKKKWIICIIKFWPKKKELIISTPMQTKIILI